MAADRTYRAQISRITGDGVWVIIPKFGNKVEYGPCQVLQDVQPIAGGGSTVSMYAQGAYVLVQTVAGVPEDLVVLGLLA